MNNPLVSIIIPVYNGSNYMREAIDSALMQTYNNCEILVINDGSDDNGETERVALSYGDKIRLFTKSNGGVASALNCGIANMHGEYFAWLSHDDIYLPEKIAVQISVLANLSDKRDIVFSGFAVIDSTGRELNRVLPLERYTQEQLETPLFALVHGMISGCGLLIHKSHFSREGLFREDLSTTQDFDLWFRVMRNNPCRVCEGVLHKTRVHGEQASWIHAHIHKHENDELWIRIMETLTDDEKTRIDGSVKRFYKNLFLHLLVHSNSKGAIRYAKKSYSEQFKHRCHLMRLVLEISGKARLLGEFIKSIKKHGLKTTIKRTFHGLRRLFVR